MKNLGIISLVFFIGLNSANAQLMETYFGGDTLNREEGYVKDHLRDSNSIIICGRSFGPSVMMQSISKIDTLGNTIWSTTSTDTSYSAVNSINGLNDVFVDRMVLSNGFIYATCIIQLSSNNLKEIWKVDASNGSILWKVPLKSISADYPQHIIDYDSTNIIVGYSNKSNGIPDTFKLAFIAKNSGNIVNIHPLAINYGTSTNNKIGLAVDSNKDIYFTKLDSIIKVSHSNLYNRVWAIKHVPADVEIYSQIYIDVNDSIYLFGIEDGSAERGKIVNINKQIGNLNWSLQTNQDVLFQDFVDRNGFLYIIWKHAYIGSGNKWFESTKVNKTAGTIVWNSSHSFTGLINLPRNRNSEAATSMDVDINGDLFLTGYYEDDNTGPASWGIVKLNGSNGNSMYEVVVTEDSTMDDKASVGVGVYLINNVPYVIGELETYRNGNVARSKTTLIKLQNSSGAILSKKYIANEFQLPSQTIQIEKYGQNQTLLFKQEGKFTSVEMYDFNKNLIWKKSFKKDNSLLAGNLAVGANGEIVFSGYENVERDSYPFYSNLTADSMFVFQLDPNGNLINNYSFNVNGNFAVPVDISYSNGGTYVFYKYRNRFNNKNSLAVRAFNILGPATSTTILDFPLASYSFFFESYDNVKYHIDYTSSTFLFFGNRGSVNRAIELNKNTLAVTSLSFIPSITKVNYVANLDSTHLILTGKSWTGSDVVIKYNKITQDTVWTSQLTPNSELRKIIFNKDSSAIYTIGEQSVNASIKKILVSNGSLQWTHTYNGVSSTEAIPKDITYDFNREQIIVTGYQLDPIGGTTQKNVFIEVLDTNGMYVNTYNRYGNLSGINQGRCAQTLFDGSIWVGGSLNDSINGKAGFIYEVNPPFSVSIDELLNPKQNNSAGIEVYPNPFSKTLYLKYFSEIGTDDSFVRIYNLQGRLIKTHVIHNQELGVNTIELSLNGLSGNYLLRFESNGSIVTEKIIAIK